MGNTRGLPLSVEDSIANAAVAQQRLNEETQKYQDAADSLRRSLGTPQEEYARTVEELRRAVQQGGLEFEFFERGVSRAAEALLNANAAATEFQAPEVTLRGSADDIRRQFLRSNGVGPDIAQANFQQDRQDLIAAEIDRIRNIAVDLQIASDPRDQRDDQLPITSIQNQGTQVLAEQLRAQKEAEKRRQQEADATNMKLDSLNRTMESVLSALDVPDPRPLQIGR